MNLPDFKKFYKETTGNSIYETCFGDEFFEVLFKYLNKHRSKEYGPHYNSLDFKPKFPYNNS